MSSRALGASASRRPRSTAVLLEARRKLPERPRRRNWVIGRSSRWFGFGATTNITQPRSAQVNSSLIFDLWALSCRRANSDDLPNLRLHNLNGLCGEQSLSFRKRQITSKGGCSRNWIEMQWRNDSSRYGALALAAHWMTALLVLASWLLGTYGDLLPRGTPSEVGLIVHMCMGLTVLIVLLPRLAWRLIDQQPSPERTHLGVWGERASTIVHYALYALLFAVLILGILTQFM